MASYRIELSISPLSHPETERVLAALRHAWQQPAWIHRQACGDICMLSIRHETELRGGEDPCWLTERIAASLWQGIGRFVRISMDISLDGEEEGLKSFSFDEADYRRILPNFRLSPGIHQA